MPEVRSQGLASIAAASATGGSDLWVASSYGSSGGLEAGAWWGAGGSYIGHLVGSRWSLWPVPLPPDAFIYGDDAFSSNPGSSLAGIYAASDSDVWAVGQYEGTLGALPLIEHWNGKRWAVVKAPPAISASYSGYSVAGVAGSGSKDVWAGGVLPADYAADRFYFAMHWNGTSWRLASPTDSVDQVQAVAMSSPGDVWMVGYGSGAGGPALIPIAYHWNGAQWNRTLIPQLSDNGMFETVTTLPGGEAWAAGQGIMARWNGRMWAAVPDQIADAGPGDEVLGLAGTSANDVWAVGTADLSDNADIEHWNGRTWNLVLQYSSASGVDQLRAVAASGRTVWALGSGQPAPLILRTTECR